jgi:hypothetical protein
MLKGFNSNKHLGNMQRGPLFSRSRCQMGPRLKGPRATAADHKASKADLSDMIEVLKADSPNLFSEQGMDLSIYSDHVDFVDPITNYDDIQVMAGLRCLDSNNNYALRLYQLARNKLMLLAKIAWTRSCAYVIRAVICITERSRFVFFHFKS